MLTRIVFSLLKLIEECEKEMDKQMRVNLQSKGIKAIK
jgi:hypothetical protein